MPVKILTVIALVLFLSGCATTRKSNNIEIQQLKGRVTSLETDLQSKEQEITRLEDELDKAHEKRTVYREENIRKGKAAESTKLSIRQMQTVLKNTGFYKGYVDGRMGPATTEAIKAFQKANGLKADGVAGRKTNDMLVRYLTESSGNRVK